MQKLNEQDAQSIGNELGIDWTKVSIKEFAMGINVELEHGSRDKDTNVTNNDPILTGKIAWAHLKEFPDYYTRLHKMESEAEKYWNAKNIKL